MMGRSIHFNLGTDEHGNKVYRTALALAIPPQEHVDRLAAEWKSFCSKFHIAYDSFYRTSSPEHAIQVQAIWEKLQSKGLIYKKPYIGDYCTGCEAFKATKDLIDGKCPDHPKLVLDQVKEENYFFRLSQFREELTTWIQSHPEFLKPKEKLAELTNLIANIDDVSISRVRKECPWGITVPNDSDQTIYVWFDALLNYIIAAGYPNQLQWAETIQICGPDNIKFQAVIFQAFLTALDIPHTKTLLVHGTILDPTGLKQGKSTGNGVDPIDQLEKFGLDAVRYYALAGLNTCTDSSWSEEQLIKTFNTEVCNDWGNMVARTLHLIDTKCQGKIEAPEIEFTKELDWEATEIKNHWLNLEPKAALLKTNAIVRRANAYIDKEKPWANTERQGLVLSNLYHLIVLVNELYSPVLINGTKDVLQGLEAKRKVIAFSKLNGPPTGKL